MKKIFLLSVLLISAHNHIIAMDQEIEHELTTLITSLRQFSTQKKKSRVRKTKSDILLTKKKKKSRNITRTISTPILSETQKFKRLIRAIKNQDPIKVKKYVYKKIINRSDLEQRTPLIWAALFGNGTIVDLLLKQGADPNRTNQNGNSPMHIALMQDQINPGIVKLLLDAGTRIYLENNNGYTAARMFKAQSKKNPALKKIDFEETKA